MTGFGRSQPPWREKSYATANPQIAGTHHAPQTKYHWPLRYRTIVDQIKPAMFTTVEKRIIGSAPSTQITASPPVAPATFANSGSTQVVDAINMYSRSAAIFAATRKTVLRSLDFLIIIIYLRSNRLVLLTSSFGRCRSCLQVSDQTSIMPRYSASTSPVVSSHAK